MFDYETLANLEISIPIRHIMYDILHIIQISPPINLDKCNNVIKYI